MVWLTPIAELDTSLSPQELTAVLHDYQFQMRVALLTAQITTIGTEGVFAINKYPPATVRYSDVHMPETPEDNYNLDPTKSVALYPLLYGLPPSPHLAGLVHSHPPTRDMPLGNRFPSSFDIDAFNRIRRANSAHIGGIALPPLLAGCDLLYTGRQVASTPPAWTANGHIPLATSPIGVPLSRKPA